MNEDQVALAQYRLEQAERTLRQAEILAEYAEWNGVEHIMPCFMAL